MNPGVKMKKRIKKDNDAQLLLITGILLATTILIIGEIATHTITLGVQSSIERDSSLTMEFLNLKEKFKLAFSENVKLLNLYYENSSLAIEDAFKRISNQFENIEAIRGIIFIANINVIEPLGERNYLVNFTLKMRDTNTYIEEDIKIQIELFANDEWWKTDESWNYRIPTIVNTQKTDTLIEREINFTQELENFNNGVFDEYSIRIIEYNKNGKIKSEIPYLFIKNLNYDSENNAIGNIFWFANGSNIDTRYYYIYVDIIGNGQKNEVFYDSLLPSPTPNSKVILDEDSFLYNFTPSFPLNLTNRISGDISFNSNGSLYFENESFGIISEENHHVSLWLNFSNINADILFGVQVDNNSWARIGYDADPVFNGSSWDGSIIGNITDIQYRIWKFFQIDLIEDLNLTIGSEVTGLTFFSDDVYYDHVVFEDTKVVDVEQLVTSVYSI